MKKIKALTLVELLVVLVTIGVLASISIVSMRQNNMEEDRIQASVYKVIHEFKSVSSKILEAEPEKCPAGQFTTSILGQKEYAIYNSTEKLATTQQVYDLYSKYLKFETLQDGFCSGTKAFKDSYCAKSDNKIPGAKITGNIYVGLEVIADTSTGALGACPEYYRLDPIEKATTTEKCWGRLYIDINGIEAPNELGKDAFVYGLSDTGVLY